MKRNVAIGTSIRLIVVLISIVAAIFWIWSCANTEMFYAAFGVSALLVVCSPFLMLKEFDLFSPWSMVVLTVAMGCAAPAVATSFNWPNEETISTTSLLGHDVEYFLYPGILMLVGFACLTMGYFLFPRSEDDSSFFFSRQLDGRRLYPSIIVCLLLAVAATGTYIVFTGGGAGKISQKRTTIRTLDVAADKGFKQHGWLRTVSKLSSVAFLVLFAYWSTRAERLTFFQTAVLSAIFLLCCVFPFYAATRIELVWLAFSAMGVMYYTNQQNLVFKFTMMGLVILVLFAAVTVMRSNSDFSDRIAQTGNHLLFNRNGPELAKTAHIINGLPGKLEYQYGKTIAVWLIAPIPRELYPDKPMIHFGPVIGRQIYGNHVSGVPPGLIGEMYLNFHIAGIVFGCFLFGVIIRRAYDILFSCTDDPAIVISVYLASCPMLTFKGLGTSVGTIISSMVFVVMATAVVWFCSIRVAERQRGMQPGLSSQQHAGYL